MAGRLPAMFADSPAASPPEAGQAAQPDRAVVLTYASLLVITAAAWVHVLRSATASDHMSGMAMAPTVADGLLYVAGWTVMMAAMMLPSALPMIALYAATQRTAPSTIARVAAVALFTLVYLGLWALTGIPIYAGSVALEHFSGVIPYGVALALVAAGVFQLTPLKQICLRQCRGPLGFLLSHWRPGWQGSVAMGWAHAVYCLGCCWALMVVLVAAGAMGLPWVLTIAAVVAAEKLLPRGEWIARLAGLALILLGVVVLLRPDWVMILRGGGHSM
jgi:predicted metal-binding membrane protein